ncbi:hypothetical protein LTS18_011552, partial [Coniosporium uncinatum]
MTINPRQRAGSALSPTPDTNDEARRNHSPNRSRLADLILNEHKTTSSSKLLIPPAGLASPYPPFPNSPRNRAHTVADTNPLHQQQASPYRPAPPISNMHTPYQPGRGIPPPPPPPPAPNNQSYLGMQFPPPPPRQLQHTHNLNVPPPPASNIQSQRISDIRPPLTSATYIPGGESFGPGVGIPPLWAQPKASYHEPQTYRGDHMTGRNTQDQGLITPDDSHSHYYDNRTYGGTTSREITVPSREAPGYPSPGPPTATLSNPQHPSHDQTGRSPLSPSDPGSQWPIEKVSTWLALNDFSKDWQEAFRTLNLHSSQFLDIGRGHGNRGSVAMMHSIIFPQLAQQCTASGAGWNQTREREEGRRLRKLCVQNFVPEPFWKISVIHEKDGVKPVTILFERCLAARTARVTKTDKKATRKWKPLPLTTVELQKCGSRFLRIDSQRVMKIAEDLYTKGWISYPRTETDQFDRGMGLRRLVEKQTQDSRWGAFAQ